MKTTPYTTKSGLKIGSHYQPPAGTYTMSRDQLALQRALLQPKGQRPGIVASALHAFWRWV